jgi:DNA-binding PadR family transcriptional regulator
MTRGKTNPFPHFQYALLGLLLKEPTYGYELHKQLSDPQGIGLVWQVKLPNLYAVLEQLEKKGWLSVSFSPGDTRPGRKMYQLTPDGRVAFEEWVNAPVMHPRDFRQEFMLKFYFFQCNNLEQLPAFLRSQLSHCRIWLKNARSFEAASASSDAYPHSVRHFRVMQIESMVNWLEEELGKIQEKNPIIKE